MRKFCLPVTGILLLFIIPFSFTSAQKDVARIEKYKTQALTDLQAQWDQYKHVALQIWGYAELGYKEVQSSALHQKTLTDNGFAVQTGVAGLPTAFVATYGSGQPVIGILAEFDALPGLSQDSVPEKKSLGAEAGHACGHHLFGTASVAAAVELKKIMEQYHLSGTIRLFGTPAEEGGAGKVYMVRDGLFKDVDVVIHWHPSTDNAVAYSTSLAVISAKFRFHGLSAHAAVAPDKGRSALDAVESMDYMVNMMREHVPSDARIHYVITNGGKAPNVVPDYAESYYFVRHYNRNTAREIFDRVVKAAQGAALGTGTTMDYEIIDGDYDILPNRVLSVAMQKDLEKVGGVDYTPAEADFAKKIQATFTYKAPPIETVQKIAPLPANIVQGPASSDVGDVSWNVPTVGLGAATWAPGTPPHSWQAVACGGTNLGLKGMMVAAKTMALMGIDLLTQPSLVTAAKSAFEKDRGPDFKYVPLLGLRRPALDYRN
ncbi:MAG: amidohydrolase [Chitinophagaceae bacterium]|nr:amidohydrolase [Chitinophagaceae bacterium]